MSRGPQSRPRPSSIDLLPEEADADIAWAIAALREGRLTQTGILEELNYRLEDKGLEPISKSAFSRWSLRRMRLARRLQETREIATGLASVRGPEDVDEVTLAITEVMKSIIIDTLEAHEEGGTKAITPKGAHDLMKALDHAITAQGKSLEWRQKVEAEVERRAEDALEKVAKSKGVTAETLDVVRQAWNLKPRGEAKS